jgi:hypothetical protein
MERAEARSVEPQGGTVLYVEDDRVKARELGANQFVTEPGSKQAGR